MSGIEFNGPNKKFSFDGALESLRNRTSTDEERRFLAKEIGSDEGKRRAYIRAVAMDALLFSNLSGAKNREDPASPAADSDSRLDRIVAEARTAFMEGAFWDQYWQQGRENVSMSEAPGQGELAPVMVTRLSGNGLMMNGSPVDCGTRLTPGLIELNEGAVDITFDSGAVILLSGPGSMRVESEYRARLISGSVTVCVPEQAKGFFMLTPNSFIRDMGTSFSVRVCEQSITEIHVLEGLVEAASSFPGDYRSIWRVEAKNALQLGPRGASKIPFISPDSMPLARPAASSKPVHFTFDGWQDNRTVSSSGHVLSLYRGENPATPELVEGLVGKALRFDGREFYGRTDFEGVGGNGPRTVSFWIRLQPDLPADHDTPNGIVAWGVRNAAQAWQVCWNTRRIDGTIGALRVEFGEGFVIGATDLRDGRWHHVAAVFVGGEVFDVATQVRIYLDGRLEAPSGRLQQSIETDTISGEAQRMIIGRYLGIGPRRGSYYLKGDLADVRVYECALLPSQVVDSIGDALLSEGPST